MIYCGSAFEPGASGLPYYCTSICVRSWCTWRASCVDSKPYKKKLQGCQGAALTLTSCPCCVLSCAHMWSRSLSFFSALVCDLLPRRLFHGSPEANCQKNISITILTSTAWRTLGLFNAFPTLVEVHHWSGTVSPEVVGSIPAKSQKKENSKLHGFEVHRFRAHRASSKATRLFLTKK